MSYQPPYTITNQILAYVSSISEKIGNISATHNLESKPHLRRNNRIRSIHSSLKIEANSLSLGQVRDVINGKIVLGKQKEIQEVKNAFDAYERIKEIDPYDIEELKKSEPIIVPPIERNYSLAPSDLLNKTHEILINSRPAPEQSVSVRKTISALPEHCIDLRLPNGKIIYPEIEDCMDVDEKTNDFYNNSNADFGCIKFKKK